MLDHAKKSSDLGDGDRQLNNPSHNATHLEFYLQCFGDRVALQLSVDQC